MTALRPLPLLFLVCAAAIVPGCSRAPSRPAGGGGIPVSAESARQGDLPITIVALGTVTPVYTVNVESRVAGELIDVDYSEGQMVKKNQLLATVDPRPYQALVLQAQGALARDQAMLKNARLDLARYQDAYRKHAIPEQELATQQATVEQDEGVVKADQGNADAAQVNLDYTRILSPIDGRVGLRLVDPGNIVQANGTTPIVTVAELQPITVEFELAEDDLSQLSGADVFGGHLRVDALDREQQRVLATGQLIAIDNEINPATGTVKGRARFDNAHQELFPNQFVNVRLYVKTLQGVILVPSAAIQRNGSASYVYVIQNGKAMSQAVRILATERETTAVTGVNAGDLLVTDGFDRLQNGSKVVVRQPAKGAAPGAAATSSGGTV